MTAAGEPLRKTLRIQQAWSLYRSSCIDCWTGLRIQSSGWISPWRSTTGTKTATHRSRKAYNRNEKVVFDFDEDRVERQYEVSVDGSVQLKREAIGVWLPEHICVIWSKLDLKCASLQKLRHVASSVPQTRRPNHKPNRFGSHWRPIYYLLLPMANVYVETFHIEKKDLHKMFIAS